MASHNNNNSGDPLEGTATMFVNAERARPLQKNPFSSRSFEGNGTDKKVELKRILRFFSQQMNANCCKSKFFHAFPFLSFLVTQIFLRKGGLER